jgi:hypothetical protein
VDAGTLRVRDVIDSTPSASCPRVAYRRDPARLGRSLREQSSPRRSRVMLSGGSVSQVLIGAQPTGLTSGMFLVSPGESITIVYSSPPAWSWFLN